MMAKMPIITIFGEDDNDQSALAELIRAIKPNCPRIEKRRKPLVLMKNRDREKQRGNARSLAQVYKADCVRFDVRLVVAHQDCDAVEPAHERLSKDIERLLTAEGVAVAIAATPAWEMEAWWYLWPTAVAAVNGRWRKLAREGQEVGLIKDAKEAFRRDLRPTSKNGSNCHDYQESDAPKIARKVRELNLIACRAARSASFERFYEQILKAKI